MSLKKALKNFWRALPRVRVSLEWPEPPKPASQDDYHPSGSYWVFYEPCHTDGELEYLHGIGVYYAESLSADGLMSSLMETGFLEGLKTGRDVPDGIHQGVVNILAVPATDYPTEASVLAERVGVLWAKGKVLHFGPDFRMRKGNTYIEESVGLNAAAQRFGKERPKSPTFFH